MALTGTFTGNPAPKAVVEVPGTVPCSTPHRPPENVDGVTGSAASAAIGRQSEAFTMLQFVKKSSVITEIAQPSTLSSSHYIISINYYISTVKVPSRSERMMTLSSTPMSISQFLFNPIPRLCSFAFHLSSISRIVLIMQTAPCDLKNRYLIVAGFSKSFGSIGCAHIMFLGHWAMAP
jgi:hypothetical protein